MWSLTWYKKLSSSAKSCLMMQEIAWTEYG